MRAQTLTGSRIRERRTMLGVKQADLARRVGISPAYLNLIEHNRRRIGGKLLVDIAEALGADPGGLSEGAGTELVAALRDAAASLPGAEVEPRNAEDLAGRFPDWARLVSMQQRRIRRLERTVEAMSDRMTHDPHLAAALHDVLTTVTAINSTASILVDTKTIEEEWRDRFHRNIHEDSERLAESSRALVAYLESVGEDSARAGAPQEELEAWLGARGYHVAELEGEAPAEPTALVQDATEITSASGAALAGGYLARYRADAGRMPLPEFQAALDEIGIDPAKLAERFGVDLAAVLRRLAAVPWPDGAPALGLAVCDGSGTLTFRKPIDEFPLPRFGAACPLWPLYHALARPMNPISAVVALTGRHPARFLTYAVSLPAGVANFDTPPVFEATMLILPEGSVTLPDLPERPVGTSCRICPQTRCVARREPSILGAP